MTGRARFALALAVVLALAGAAPVAGDRTAAGNVGDTGDVGVAANAGVQTTDETVVIETENFDPNYDPETVLKRVEELRGLSATQGITLHEYDDENASTYDMRDKFGAIRPAGARTLQLFSNASTERRQPLGYAVERQAAVHIYLMNASDLKEYGVPQEVVLAHELVHALQFQTDLLTPSRKQFRSQFQRWTTDSRLVTTAVVEGDAMWVTQQYFRQYAPGEGNYTVADYNRTLARAAWPHSIAGTPYYYGYEFYEAAGSAPEKRSAVIRNPPRSTAELLHPGESIERKPLPNPPQLPDESDLTRYHTDTVGELVIRHALRINGLSFSRAADAADGWANDRMYYFAAGGAAGPATHWTTVWASEGEATEFAEAWRSVLDARGARPVGETGEMLYVPASDHVLGLYYVVEQEGETVRITAAKRADTTERLASVATENGSAEETAANAEAANATAGVAETPETAAT